MEYLPICQKLAHQNASLNTEGQVKEFTRKIETRVRNSHISFTFYYGWINKIICLL